MENEAAGVDTPAVRPIVAFLGVLILLAAGAALLWFDGRTLRSRTPVARP